MDRQAAGEMLTGNWQLATGNWPPHDRLLHDRINLLI